MSEIQRQNQEGESNFADLQQELSLKQYESFVDSLEKESLDDVHKLLFVASQKDPIFQTSLQRFQEQQSQSLKINFQQLYQTQETKLQKSPELLSQDLQKLLEVGKKELQNIENQQKILHQKKLQIELIQEVASTYKEYLQSIASSLSFKIISSKDERYQTQIDTMTQKIQEISFLVKYLDVTKNYEELKNLNINNILNTLFVSEEKISQSGIMHHPTASLWNEKISIQAVNAGYEDIKKLLQTPHMTPEKAQNIKMQIFEKLRFFDVSGVDDNNLIYDTSAPISSRIRSDVMQNPELRKTAGIENVFLFLENVSAEEKQKLYKSLLDNRETFYKYMNTLGVVHEFDFKNEKEKQEFFKEIFKELRTQINDLKDEDIQKSLKTQLTKQYDYLLNNVPKEKREEYEEKKKNAFENIDLLTKVAKQEMIFEGFKKIFVNKILEKNASQVETLSQKDKSLQIYADIEGIGNKWSDETVNNITSTTTFIIEQVVLMYVSGGIGNLTLKGATSGITKLAPTVENTHRGVKFLGGVAVESTAFYGAYTMMNGMIHQESYGKIAESFSGYDYLRTIAFLGVLRGIPLEKMKNNLTINNTTLNETKNIVLDTASVLGTDIVIRTTIGELFGKEGIPRDELGEITLQKSREFLLEEIAFILPLVVGLRQSDKTIGAIFEQKPAPKVEVLSQRDQIILKIEGISKDIIILKKDIRNLEQSRNILRNKDKPTQEINTTLQDKKAEVKDLKIQEQQLTTKLQNIQEPPTPVIQNPQASQNLTIKETHSARSNVNMNTGSKNIQEFFKGKNIEDVMKGFDSMGNKMTEAFQSLLQKGGNKVEAENLINSQIAQRIDELTAKGVKIDDIGKQYIKRFAEARIAEFNKLLEIKEKGGLIPREIEMTISGMKPWRLELNNVKMMNEFFGEFAKKIAENRKQESMKLKNN